MAKKHVKSELPSIDIDSSKNMKKVQIIKKISRVDLSKK